MNRFYSHAAGLFAIAFFGLVLTSCGGGGGDGGGDGGGGGNQGAGFVTIDSPTSAASYDSVCETVPLSGTAFISPTWWHCCSGSASDTGVTVTWTNSATGVSQPAHQDVDICYLLGTPYLCNHTWSASVPLVLGYNPIKVTASDPSGVTASKTITVYKSEHSYTITGQVTYPNSNGTGLAGIKISVAGGTLSQWATTGADGRYAMSCVPNGTYNLTASSSINYVFTPASLMPVINNADVTDQNFVTEAYQVAGIITDHDPSTNYYGTKVDLTGSSSATAYTDNSGGYLFVLPNGAYTLTPSDIYNTYGSSYTPYSRSVLVDHANIGGLDFDRY